tara:strand:- start:414 stop:803 length:390 start_codon:yes stop_codon:yes gene_type:complete
MRYKRNNFFIENFNVNLLANKFKTPSYCYSYKKIKENILYFNKTFKKIKPIICFSVKANPNKIILREIRNLGLGADVVSIGELMVALKSGIKPGKIVFSGVGKTFKEIEYALKKKYFLLMQSQEVKFFP